MSTLRGVKIVAATLLVLATVSCGSAPPPAPAPAPAPAAPPVAKPPSLTGIWLGTLDAGGPKLRVQLHLDLAATPAGCSLDSLDQQAMGIPCVVASKEPLTLQVPLVHGGFEGTSSTDGNTVTGTFTQGGMKMPLVLTRQAKAIEAAKIAMDPDMPPVAIDKLQAVLDKDLEKLLAGELAPATGVGVTIGVIAHGTRKVWSYGSVKPDSVFEIGSVTKTFTGLVLAQLVEQKKVKLDEPVRTLLPKDTVAAPAAGPEITLLDLSAQRSGMPRMPDNFKPADLANPYADYDKKLLYAFVASHGVALPAKPEFGYSNLGVGLLGQALAERAGSTYEALVTREVLAPLGMKDSGITLTPALTKRFAAGHAEKNAAQRAWDLGALGGAGAIRSTAADMLTYLDAQLHPDHVRAKSAEAKTLAAAITASHQIQSEAGGGMHIALNWLRVDATGSFWHNGATGGYSSFVMFNPDQDLAVVVLCNRSVDDGALSDDLGKHVIARLTGKPAETISE